MIFNSKFSSFKIIKFLTILVLIIYLYYFAIYGKTSFKFLFSSLNRNQTLFFLLSLFVSLLCYIFFTTYIYKKPKENTQVVGMPMESEGQFYYLVAYSILLLSSLLFAPFVFNYAIFKDLDVGYIIQALSYLILFATIGIILLFNNTKFSLQNRKEKIVHTLVWVSLFYFFIQISFLDIGFWIPKYIK